MSITPSVKYVKVGGSMVAKPVSVRVSGAWKAIQSVPTAPTSVVASPADGQATVTWNAPANTGGIPLTGYAVTASPGGATASASTTSAIVNGLTDGTAYNFTVKATNAVGAGAGGTTASSATPYTVTGQLYVSPSSSSYAVGSTITMQVHENSFTDAVNSFQANITYPSALLQFESSDVTASPFTQSFGNTGGSGTIQISAGNLVGSSTGDQIVSTVTFTVLAAGIADIAIDSGTSGIAQASDSTNICNSYVGARFTLS